MPELRFFIDTETLATQIATASPDDVNHYDKWLDAIVELVTEIDAQIGDWEFTRKVWSRFNDLMDDHPDMHL